jgi:hypothetical protein
MNNINPRVSIIWRIIYDSNLKTVRILITLSILLTLIQLFTEISFNYQIIVIQVIIFPHWAASIFLEKVELKNQISKIKASISVGGLVALVPAILLSIKELSILLSSEFNNLIIDYFGAEYPPSETVIFLGIIGAVLIFSSVLICISGFSGFLAAILPTRRWIGKLDIR